MSDEVQLILGIVFSYLLGSIPTSVWVGRYFFNTDVREHGSGNAGATNTIRVLGWKAGIPVFVFDVFKAWLVVYAVQNYLDWNYAPEEIIYIQIAFGLAAVLGHVYPIYVGFKGGKGVGAFAGMAIALFPLAFVSSFAIFLLVVITTKYVSLGSILAALSFPFFLYFVFHVDSVPLLSLGVFATLFIIFTHRKNIVKLLNAKENKFSAKKN
ncbi:MAG: acyl-phosphate glycerol 3-phosphate acyltransferase [Bacteroidetes bacterium 4572_77]|nr:MAG: acyl-phosphate glycerol 3-phosphate acyltransferase [Bacteroidetes bacterium 4572_77]